MRSACPMITPKLSVLSARIRLRCAKIPSAMPNHHAKRVYHQCKALYIINRQVVYHQRRALYIINPKDCILPHTPKLTPKTKALSARFPDRQGKSEELKPSKAKDGFLRLLLAPYSAYSMFVFTAPFKISMVISSANSSS